MPAHPSAEHMSWAIRAIYTNNTSPNVSLFPSGGAMISTGEQDVFGNFAIGLSPEDVGDAADHLSKIDAPSMFLEAGDRNETFESTIARSGFAHVGAIPAMTVDLDQLPAIELPDGYHFERVWAGDDGSAWAQALTDGYPVAAEAAKSMSPIHAHVSDEDAAPIQFFQVRVGDIVAGVSALALLNDLAGIYCVATLPEHRRKGLGAALTAMPLMHARELGYRSGVLQSSESGYPVYRRLGFEDSGEVQLYMRTPPVTEIQH